MLLPNDRKNKVVVDDGTGEETQFVKGVGGLKSFTIPASGADGRQGLIDRPSRPTWIQIWVEEGDNS